MPFSNPAYTPAVGVAVTLNNPAQAQGTGALPSAAAVIANNSPYALGVSSGEGAVTASIYPFTRDIVTLDREAGQQLVLTPIDIGQVAPSTVEPLVFVTWYQANEATPENLPISIGNTSTTTSTQQVLIGSGPSATLEGTHVQFEINPLWRSIWVACVDPATVGVNMSEPVLSGGSGLLYGPIFPPYLVPGFPAYQGFWRFIIVSALEAESGLADLLLPGMAAGSNGTIWWGADLADVDATTYDTNGSSGVPNTPTPHDFSYDAPLVAGSFPGFFVSTPAGSKSYLTRLWGTILAGTSVDVTVRVSTYLNPGYAAPVNVAGWDPITIDATPGGLVLPTQLEVFDLDYVDVDLSNLVAAPGEMALLVDELVVPS